MRWWLSLVLLLGLGAQTAVWAAETIDPNEAVRQGLQSELEDFSVPGWDRRPAVWPQAGDGPFVPEAGPALKRYRERLVRVADWTGGPVWHQAGTLPQVHQGKTVGKLGVNVFFPPGHPRGTLLFVHGYLSHAANFAYTFAWFVAKGWAVVTLDLPGHGLSTGPRGDVESFSDYGDAVQSWLAWQKSLRWDGPRVLVAHSLGTAAVFDALGRPGTAIPDRVVFCAPLLRPRWFSAVTLAAMVTAPWVEYAPPSFGWDGYLDGYRIPTHWFRALDAWLGSLDNRRPLNLPLSVFSGDRDEVVDADWNLAEYRRLVPDVQELVLAGRGHLFLSDPGSRQGFHALLDQVVAPVAFGWSETRSLAVTLESGQAVSVNVGISRPETPSRGTLLFIPGFKASAGEFGPLLGTFVARGWTVCALELPGQGASGGPRDDIADFADYGTAVQTWLAWVNGQGWPGRQILVAHSLGAAAAFEALRRPGAQVPDQIVFCGPLLRTAWYGPVSLVAHIPGVPYGHWLGALDRWLARIEAQKPLSLPLTIYTGTGDMVIDADRNRVDWQRLVPGAREYRLPGRDHWFLQEPGAREEFLVTLGNEVGW